MLRLIIVIATILALFAAGRSECSPTDGRPGIDGAVWQAAGIVPIPHPAQAPPLRIGDLSGKTVALRHLRGRLVMLYFWATW